MHDTALVNGKAFFDTYVQPRSGAGLTVVDIGALNVNGSLREVCPEGVTLVGVDFSHGPGVDIVLNDPYLLPFGDNEVDVVVSSSCFEHAELFWVLFLELLRVVKPDGLVFLNVPSNGAFHRCPVDCWRFYPDSGRALVKWAHRNGYSSALLESYVSAQSDSNPWGWSDFVAVFVKDAASSRSYPNRIIDRNISFKNGLRLGSDEFINYANQTEDMQKLRVAGALPQMHLPIE
ncbi:MAG: class I SAM-dependent methyltransferase [Betaproteobacteria bacterium]